MQTVLAGGSQWSPEPTVPAWAITLKTKSNDHNGLYRGCTGLNWGYILMMEKKREATIGFRASGLRLGLLIRIMEKKMDTTII